MKWNKIGRGSLASIVSVAMGLGLTACSKTYTVGYVYMTTAKANPGLMNGYEVDYQSGTLNVLTDSPIPTNGRNPVTVVAAPNGHFLYVLNHDDSTVTDFAIGTDGKVYPQAVYNIGSGTNSPTLPTFPTAGSIDPSGKFLYVTFTYQGGYTTALPGPGGIAVFPINSDNTLGKPSTVNAGRNPVAITATNSNHFVYVVDQDSATTQNLLAFTANTTTGLLTPLPGVTINNTNAASTGFASGVTPNAILQDASSQHLYITDQASNQVLTYSIGSTGVPTLIATAPTDAGPDGLTIDVTGKFLFVVNYTAGTISGYTFGSNGQPVPSTVAASVQAGTGPTCITTIGVPTNANPSHAVYVYVSNQLSNNITGLQMNTTTGALELIQNTPFSGSALPTCITSVPSFR
ncbi:MAG: beta-propeller fold lactonase family protein [Acidobacteriota bacterium]|nr:beta-propeller fold lactonase family protein [Acidobacteriota bacterium]